VAVFRFTSEFSGVQQAVNVWHFITAGAPTTAQANEAIMAVDAFFTAFPSSMAAGTWTHGSRVTTVDQTPNFVIPATVQTTTTTGSTPSVLSAAAGITWQTPFIGRSYRGRSFIGPLAGVSVASGGFQVTTSFQTTLQTAANALFVPTASGATLCVWSEKLAIGNAVTSALARLGLHTQRRRLT